MSGASKHLMSLSKTFCTFSLCLLLFSCAIISVNTNQWKQRQADLIAVEKVSFKARVVLNKPNFVYNFNLGWEQQGNTFTITGFDFLGRQLFTISGNQDIAEFTSGKKVTRLRSKAFMRQQIGLDIEPIIFLHLLQAMEVEAATTLFKNNIMTKQTLGNIEITYNRYDALEKYIMPASVSIRADTIQLKMVLHSWNHGDNELAGHAKAE